MTIFIAILLGVYFSNGIGGTPLQIISEPSFQEDMLFPVLIDNCVILLLNVYAVFIVHGGLTLTTLKNKKATLPLLIFKDRGAKFILEGLKFQSSIVTIVGLKKSLQ